MINSSLHSSLAFTIIFLLLSAFLSVSFTGFIIAKGRRSLSLWGFALTEILFAFFAIVMAVETILGGFLIGDTGSFFLILLFSLSGFLFAFSASLFERPLSLSRLLILILIFLVGASFPVFWYMDFFHIISFLKIFPPDFFFFASLGYFYSLALYQGISLIFRRFSLEDRNLRQSTIFIALSLLPLFCETALLFGAPPFLSYFLVLHPLLLWYALVRYEWFGVVFNSKDSIIAGSATFLFGSLLSLTAFFSNEISGVFSIPSWLFLIVSILLFLCFGVIAFRRQREFDSMKYEFVNVVTHKFRTPLSAIKWASDNLKKDMTKDERLLFAKQIESSADRLTEITNTLVGVAETGDRYSYIFVAHSFREIVESVLDRQGYKAREKGITLNISIDRELPSLSLDIKKIQFVVEVLFENAVRYSPPHSAININVSRTQKGVLLSVSDNGMGVKKEDLPNMFEKFFRSREATKIDTEGMGLGLFLAKNIVDRHGGRVWVESDGEGKGATFLVELYLNPRE